MIERERGIKSEKLILKVQRRERLNRLKLHPYWLQPVNPTALQLELVGNYTNWFALQSQCDQIGRS